MTIKNLIRFPKECVICEKIYSTEKGTIIPANSKIFSGVTGNQLGIVMKTINFDFPVSLLSAQTTGKNFTIKHNKYYFAETDLDGKILEDGLLVPKGVNLNFTSLNDFIMDQEITYQESLPKLAKKLYLLKARIRIFLKKHLKI